MLGEDPCAYGGGTSPRSLFIVFHDERTVRGNALYDVKSVAVFRATCVLCTSCWFDREFSVIIDCAGLLCDCAATRFTLCLPECISECIYENPNDKWINKQRANRREDLAFRLG